MPKSPESFQPALEHPEMKAESKAYFEFVNSALDAPTEAEKAEGEVSVEGYLRMADKFNKDNPELFSDTSLIENMVDLKFKLEDIQHQPDYEDALSQNTRDRFDEVSGFLKKQLAEAADADIEAEVLRLEKIRS